MNIYIVANFVPQPYDKTNNRFVYLAKMLAENNNVTLLTSSFSHENKAQKEEKKFDFANLKIVNIHESGYPKNICLKRFVSHYGFGKRIGKYLNSVEEKIDVIYLAIPSLTCGSLVVKYCRKHKTRLIVDIQDLWPEAFKMVFNPPILGRLAYAPFYMIANKIYKNADEIVAVSDTYKDRGLAVNIKNAKGLTVYLGTNIAKFDEIASVATNDVTRPFTVVYIGTLGASYNLIDVEKAIKLLIDKGLNIKFLVIGDGPQRNEFEMSAKALNINAEFTGLLPYVEMVKRLVGADLAVNPIHSGSAASIINKVGDYAAGGLAVINTQESVEYRDKIEELNIGFNVKNGDVLGIAEAIEKLYENKALRIEMGANNRKWAETSFDRAKTYMDIVKMVEKED
ncbi:MAG: glycosyltransferase family 4 protein [Clostridia bacterium]